MSRDSPPASQTPSPTGGSDVASGRASLWAAWLHRHFLWFLIGSYALAAVWPRMGLAIRNVTIVDPSGREVHAPMLLLALLLFCAAAVIRWSEFRDLWVKPSVMFLGLAAAWAGPAVFVAVLAPLIMRTGDPESAGGVLVGLALVAAMPVANSSAGWSQNAGGNVALSLAMITLSILLSPIMAPQMLQLMGFVLSDQVTQQIESVVARFSGAEFILWVILPSLAGAAVGSWAGPERIAKVRMWIRLITLIDLLLLNYANAALAMPKVVATETLLSVTVPMITAAAVSLLGVLLAIALARYTSMSGSSRIAMLFALSMKHTGLALVLAGEVLAESPRVILTILLATVLQHIVAATVDWWLQRGGRGDSTDPTDRSDA